MYDRDGFLVATCMRGDMYIRDPMNTPGHGTEVSQAVWHPTSKDVSSLLLLLSTETPFAHMHRFPAQHFMTCGIDGTLRVWNITGPMHFDELKNEQVRCSDEYTALALLPFTPRWCALLPPRP